MSLRRKLLFGLISLICFCIGVTATVLFSPGRDFKSVFPHVRHRSTYYSPYAYRLSTSCEDTNGNVDEIMANSVAAIDGVADQQTLDQFKRQVDRLETGGRAFLGIYMGREYNGVQIYDLINGFPAETAGLQRRDVITAINGRAVSDHAALVRALLNTNPSEKLTVTFRRYGETSEVSFYPATRQVPSMPMTHRALGYAFASLGRKLDAIGQLNSYLSEQAYPSDDTAIRAKIDSLR
ncbi:MAG TPA: PDZ domain-containing protein [Blastocatellia bacterium]|nr:PDZ domain-containing protein [Blastocatellia bacterium]